MSCIQRIMELVVDGWVLAQPIGRDGLLKGGVEESPSSWYVLLYTMAPASCSGPIASQLISC